VMISANAAISGAYDYGEVARSVFIAIAASYAALDLTGRVTAARGRARLAWLSGGAIAMGIGIWEMHFKGMMAFRLPVPVQYHWPTVLASLLVAILASAVALYVASRQKVGTVEALTGSVFMGGAIASMHYIGMAAMRIPAITRYSPPLVTCSILFAILFSLIALLMAFGLRRETKWTVPRRLGSATVMGAAVSAMHYTGMAAASFIPAPPPDLSHAVNISPFASNGIAIVTLIAIMAAITTSSVDRRAAVEVQRLNQALERRVADSEERFRKLVEALPDSILVHSGNRIVFVNPCCMRLLGAQHPEQLLGKDVLEIIHPDYREAIKRRIRHCYETGAASPAMESAFLALDGSPIQIEAAAIPIFWNGSPAIEVIVRDIRERKRAEEALQQSKADVARVTRIATMGELTASIAHEINQPLGAVVTNGNAALRWLAGQPPNLEEVREAIERTIREATRASDVIGRIRALLQKGPPQMARLDVNAVIQEVLTLADNELLRSGVTVQTELAADVPVVLGDRVQLQQVILNLILNGIEAMSTTTDRRRELRIKSAKHPDGALVQIHDSGEGVDAEQADHIFEPFFTTKPQGIGMGLSVGRSMVEAQGGRLWFTPGPSHGAVFQFTVPKAD
jgi:two-component system, sensor histidine kinase and response regulator